MASKEMNVLIRNINKNRSSFYKVMQKIQHLETLGANIQLILNECEQMCCGVTNPFEHSPPSLEIPSKSKAPNPPSPPPPPSSSSSSRGEVVSIAAIQDKNNMELDECYEYIIPSGISSFEMRTRQGGADDDPAWRNAKRVRFDESVNPPADTATATSNNPKPAEGNDRVWWWPSHQLHPKSYAALLRLLKRGLALIHESNPTAKHVGPEMFAVGNLVHNLHGMVGFLDSYVKHNIPTSIAIRKKKGVALEAGIQSMTLSAAQIINGKRPVEEVMYQHDHIMKELEIACEGISIREDGERKALLESFKSSLAKGTLSISESIHKARRNEAEQKERRFRTAEQAFVAQSAKRGPPQKHPARPDPGRPPRISDAMGLPLSEAKRAIFAFKTKRSVPPGTTLTNAQLEQAAGEWRRQEGCPPKSAPPAKRRSDGPADSGKKYAGAKNTGNKPQRPPPKRGGSTAGDPCAIHPTGNHTSAACKQRRRQEAFSRAPAPPRPAADSHQKKGAGRTNKGTRSPRPPARP